MSAVQLDAADLALLSRLTPDLDFSDAERQAALLESASRDFNAVPGSGKTSLLAAKLLLLARKWPYRTKGVCILSHTNVAREEITRRLARTDEGARLLAYPHFIGTIHGFVNQFLALPLLRSLGLPIEVIDDEAFASRAIAMLKGRQYFTLRAWLSHQALGDALVGQLYFKGAELELSAEGASIPGPGSTSGKQLADIKRRLTEEGVFRHRDMFAFALAALNSHPNLLDVIYRRFPMVFVDEMQDTSWEQEEILNLLFDGKSVIQRFGDVDQKIISNDHDSDKVSFPRPGHGSISSSKRFGARIAAAVASVRISKLPVTGDCPDVIKPVLLLYTTEKVTHVVPHFGKLVLDRFDVSALPDKAVRAMCTRRAVDGKVDAGRHLVDYWPAYAHLKSDVSAVENGFWSLIDQASVQRSAATLSQQAAAARKALLLVLRSAKAPVATDLRDARSLARAVAAVHGSAADLNRLIHELVLGSVSLIKADAVNTLLVLLYRRLANLLPDGMPLAEFAALDVFSRPPLVAGSTSNHASTCIVSSDDGRQLGFDLGTVAGMKGETHVASLVLESYGGRSKKFDLELALPVIAGLVKDLDKLSALQQSQMRNVYVAMSRPTHFLCLAANQSRVSSETLFALQGKGWQVEQLN